MLWGYAMTVLIPKLVCQHVEQYNCVHFPYFFLYKVTHTSWWVVLKVSVMHKCTKTAIACTCMHGFGSNFVCKLIGPIRNFFIFLTNWIRALFIWFLGDQCNHQRLGRISYLAVVDTDTFFFHLLFLNQIMYKINTVILLSICITSIYIKFGIHPLFSCLFVYSLLSLWIFIS